MSLSAISQATATVGFVYNVTGPIIGPDYQGNVARGTPQLQKSYTLGADVAGKIDQIYSTILTIAASATNTLDLTVLQNVTGDTFAFTRVQGWCIRLLSVANDPTNGTACTGVTVGNASTPFLFNTWSAAATQVIGNGEGMAFATPSAAGYPVGTAKHVKILNNDGGVAAAVEVTFWGCDA